MNDSPSIEHSIETSEDSRRRLSAVMFTDIKGFTSLMESDETTAVGLVKHQREVVRRQVAQHGGEERETIGDAHLVIFESAVKAVACAIAIQRDLWEFNQRKDAEKQVWLRIGIHLGDILIEEGSIFGEGVNLAARVQALSKPGGVCITQQVYDQIKHQLDVKAHRLSVKELKNVTDVPNVYQLQLSTIEPEGPPTLGERIWRTIGTPPRLAAIGGSAGLAIALLLYWLFFATTTITARQVAFVHHRPVPRFTIGAGTAKKLDRYYAFTRRGRHIVKLELVQKPAALPEDALAAWNFPLRKEPRHDFPVHTYRYDGGRVARERIADAFGFLQYILDYGDGGRTATVHDEQGYVKTFENQISTFGFAFDKHGFIAKRENRNAFGTLRTDMNGAASYRYRYDANGLPIEIGTYDVNGNPVEDKEGTAVTLITYDARGLPTKRALLDRYRAPEESVHGYAIVEYDYDDAGRLVRERYADVAGRPAANDDGICAKKMTHDEEGFLVAVTTLSCSDTPKATRRGYATTRFTIQEGRVIAQRFLDETGKPTVNDEGVSLIKVTYGPRGQVASLAFFGLDDKPATNKEQYHAARFLYDDAGRPIDRLFLGPDNKPVIAGRGYAEARLQYDERGEPTEWSYLDTQGNPVNSHEGYATLRNEYDQFGNLISRSFFDKSGQPAYGRDDTCHRITIAYDDKGDLDETRCFDGEGKLTPGIKNCAISRYEYDQLGKLTRFECYVDEGKLIDLPNLPSILEIQYDKRGNMREVRAYDAKGELAERYEGAAIWKAEYDENGNQVEIATYDRNGNRIDNPKYKAAIFRREFDNRGNVLRVQTFDQNAEPTTGIWGFAEIRYTYDDIDQQTSEAFFNGDGEPAENLQGIHERRTIYDDRGRAVEIRELDDEGKPVADSTGVAIVRMNYDRWDRIAERQFFGPEGKPTINVRLGCARATYSRDDRGNVTELRCYGLDGELCREKNCIAVTQQRFDAKGRMTRQLFFDAAGKRTTDERGAGGYENEYDLQGRIAVQHVIGVDDKHAADADGVHEYHLFYRPERDQLLWFLTFFDAAGKPTRAKSGGTMRVILYDPLYRELPRARVDTTTAGGLNRVECLDRAGNETGRRVCVTAAELRDQLARITPLLKNPAREEQYR